MEVFLVFHRPCWLGTFQLRSAWKYLFNEARLTVNYELSLHTGVHTAHRRPNHRTPEAKSNAHRTPEAQHRTPEAHRVIIVTQIVMTFFLESLGLTEVRFSLSSLEIIPGEALLLPRSVRELLLNDFILSEGGLKERVSINIACMSLSSILEVLSSFCVRMRLKRWADGLSSSSRNSIRSFCSASSLEARSDKCCLFFEIYWSKANSLSTWFRGRLRSYCFVSGGRPAKKLAFICPGCFEIAGLNFFGWGL